MYPNRLWLVLFAATLAGCPTTPPTDDTAGDAALVTVPSVIAADAPAPGTLETPPETKAITSDAPAAPLAVVSHVPKRRLGAYARPAVVFNKPVQPFGVEAKGPAPAEIRPWVPGQWKWLGSSVLEFDSRERLPLSTQYWVEVGAGLKSLDGGELRHPYSFTFETQRVAAIGGRPVGRWSNFKHAVPDQNFQIRFNQPVVADSLDSSVYVKGGGQLIPLSLKRLEPLGKADPRTGQRRDLRTVAHMVPRKPLPLNTQLQLIITQGVQSQEGPLPPAEERRWAFETYGPLKLDSAECYGERCPRGPIQLRFSNEVRRDKLMAALSFNPPVKFNIREDDGYESRFFTVSGPFQPATQYTVRVQNLVDVFGQTLADASGRVFTGDYWPSFDPVYGQALIEKGQREALPLTHVNVPSFDLWSARLSPVEFVRRLAGKYPKDVVPQWSTVQLPEERNRAKRSPIDLGPAFDAGPEKPGRLAEVRLRRTGQKFGSKRVVQVTDIASVVKTSPLNVSVFAWHLSTGAPATDAAVSLLDEKGDILARGRTDAQGMALLPGTKRLGLDPESWYDVPFLAAMVEKGDDISITGSSGNWNWSPGRFGIWGTWVDETPLSAGTIFVDRGIYRPGEPVYVKGFLRFRNMDGLGVPEGAKVHVKLLDADGEKVVEQEETVSAFGGFHARFELPKDRALGRYSVYAEIKERKLSWRTYFRVAEYRAPRFLVSVSGSQDQIVGSRLRATVEGRYLFGAPVSGAPVEWSSWASRTQYSAPDGDDYRYGRDRGWGSDAAGDFQRSDGGAWTLDNTGQFVIAGGVTEAKLDPMRYEVEAKVTDVDRQVVAGRTHFMVHPAAHYLGLKGPDGFGEAGQAMSVSVRARDVLSKARIAVKDVQVELVQRVWKTVKKKNAWGGFENVSEAQEITVDTCTADASIDGEGACSVTPESGGSFSLVVKARDRDGREAVSSERIWVLGAGEASWYDDDSNMVKVLPEKTKYGVGETARLLIQNPYKEAQAWVTVEREGVLWQKRMTLTDRAVAVDIPVTDKMLPNAYVGVVLTRGRVEAPGNAGDPGRPTMRMGYAELKVERTSKRLSIDLKPDTAEKRPGDTLAVDVAVSDHLGAGVKSEVAVWAVDEGVLALTGYEAPDLLAALHTTQGLSMVNSTNVDRLIAQHQYGEKGKEPGGGGGGGDNGAKIRNQFVTTPIFLGSVLTDAKGKARVEGDLPDNLTTFRLMAVGMTASDQAGSGKSKVLVTKPLLARPSMPRAARTGDQFLAGVVVNNRQDAPATVKVHAAVEGPAKLIGGTTRTVRVTRERAVEVRFGYTASGVGDAKFTFRIEADGKSADAVERTIPIKGAASPEAFAVYGDTASNQLERLQVPKGLLTDQGGLEVTLASSALAGLADNAEDLVKYPYGCLEQQSSRLVPFIVLHELLEKHGEKLTGGQDPDAVVKKTLDKLAQMQLPYGGFAYWPGGKTRAHYWGTAYAALAVAGAKARGYDTRKIDLEGALKYLEKAWRAPLKVERTAWWSGERRLESRAFAAYVLARLGNPQPAFTDELYAEREKLALFGRGFLAYALAATPGGQARAKGLVGDFMDHARLEADTAHFVEQNGEEYAVLFHSDTRTTAIALQAFLKAKPDHPLLPKMARYLLEVRKEGGYRTTQEAAFSLLALADFAAAREPDGANFVGKVQLGGKELVTAPFKGKSLASVNSHTPMSGLADIGEAGLSFGVEGEGRLYYGARLRYTPVDYPREAASRGLIVQRWYTLEDGPEGAVHSVEEGALVRVHLRVATHQNRHYVAIEDPLPAGLEPVDTTLKTTASAPRGSGRSQRLMARRSPQRGHWASVFDRTERRDDRIRLFSDRLPIGVHHFSYLARATTAGTFAQPPAHAEEMYTPEVSGRSRGGVFYVHPAMEISQR